MQDSTGYDFSAIKLKVMVNNQKSKEEVDLFIKLVKKDKIKESIFCYWSLLYDELFKHYDVSEFTSVINKVRITETESEEYKHSVLLQIKENKWGVLECGSTIHLVKFAKYLQDNSIKKSNFINEWKKYVEDENEDVLFIGVVN